MTKGKLNRAIAVLLFIVSIALICTGAYGMAQRQSAASDRMIDTMRVHALLNTTGEGAAEAFVEAAKKQARESAKGQGMEAVKAAVAKAEEEARANASNIEIDYETVDSAELTATSNELMLALKAYYAEEAKAQAEYAATQAAVEPIEEEIIDEAPPAAEDAIGDDMGMDDLPMVEEPKVDLSGFQATPEMLELRSVADEKYNAVAVAVTHIYEGMEVSALDPLKETIEKLVYQSGDKFETLFDRYAALGSSDALKGDLTVARITRYADDMVTIGIAILILALLVLFYRSLVKSLGLPRLIIGMFFVLLCVLSVIYDLSISALLSNTIVRMGMNSVLVLAMVPAIQSGISLNLGLPIGIIGGLIGGLTCIELGFSGWQGFVFAIAMGLVISCACGILYGMLLNRLKGSEMAVTTYVGFSIVSLMCMAWMLLPFKSPQLRWPLGTGLRVTLSLKTSYKHILNNLWSFTVGGVTIPTGLLLFMALMCLLVWLFLRSKTGTAMQAVGNNPRFAEATGINVDKMRIIGTTLSTMLGAVGIIVFSQSYGFMQLYNAPKQLGFIAASAILIGGASTSRARISHVLIGTFLFQGVLTLGMPVANVLVPQSTLSETMRILISNGIILYALTKSGGESRA